MKISTILLINLIVISQAYGQISQTHPELCGKPNSFLPLPSEISVSLDPAGENFLFLGKPPSGVKIVLPGLVGNIEEVCPISHDRLVLFASTYHTTNVIVVDSAHRLILDSFDGFDPILSPDQRWLILRKFYPRTLLSVPSEEYLLYDLSKTPQQNRMTPQLIGSRDYVGRVIFPPSDSPEPYVNFGIGEQENTHFSASESFFWAPDSRAVAFGDTLQGHSSVVVVTIDDRGNTNAYVRPVTRQEACRHLIRNGDLNTDLFVLAAEFGGLSSDRKLQVTFRPMPGACDPKPMTFDLRDFVRAKTEPHADRVPERIKSRRKAIVVDH